MGKTIVVIGGGASGLVAAITAARSGAKVTILEQNNRLGKKILSTGNGRCNLANTNQNEINYRSSDASFTRQVLSCFPLEQTLTFFRELGIYTKDKNGYLYPRSNQAASVVEALKLEAGRLRIKCKTQEEVTGIQKNDAGFTVFTKTWHYECDRVILACGSKASLAEGSERTGYQLAEKLGHTIVEPLPALTGLRGSGSWFSKWAGVRCDASVTLFIDEKEIISDTGEVQLTDYGISGIPVFQVSRYASRAIYAGHRVQAVLDFLPEYSESELETILSERIAKTDSFKEALLGFFSAKLIDVLISKKDTLQDIMQKIKYFSIPIKGTMDFSHAQICTGGVSLSEISGPTMESRILPGIYFCGELVDVDGACGGYNLQWAWSSGYVAGISASKETL